VQVHPNDEQARLYDPAERGKTEAWVILDARYQRIPNYKLALRTDKPPLVGQTLAELAGKIGLPAGALRDGA